MFKLKKILAFILCTVIINTNILSNYIALAIGEEETSSENISKIITDENTEFTMNIDEYGKFTMKLEDALRWNPKVSLDEGKIWFYIANMPELLEEDIVTFNLPIGESHLLIEDEAGNILHNGYYNIENYENTDVKAYDYYFYYSGTGYKFYYDDGWKKSSGSININKNIKVKVTSDEEGNNIIFSGNYLAKEKNKVQRSYNNGIYNGIYLEESENVTYSINDGEKLQANGKNMFSYLFFHY